MRTAGADDEQVEAQPIADARLHGRREAGKEPVERPPERAGQAEASALGREGWKS